MKSGQFKNLTKQNQKQIFFQSKNWLQLELLTPETMKLLESGKKDVDKDKDGENVPKLESAEVVLVCLVI